MTALQGLTRFEQRLARRWKQVNFSPITICWNEHGTEQNMTDSHPFGDLVTSTEELREIVQPPSSLVRRKVISSIDPHVRRFLGLTPYVILATCRPDGRCDSSPRGGAPGFIEILDDRHFLIREATGNRRCDTMLNLLENPGFGMLAIVPGLDETLRINGRAYVCKGGPQAEPQDKAGTAPQLAIGFEVTECYLHCAKAAMRSTLWNPLSWVEEDDLPPIAEIFRDHTKGAEGDGSVEHIEALLQDSYTNRL
ncbi:MSMEG_1061 family FMN-dependent PPOX-type flavoprotein [Salipiger sp. PrR002]|uniref:MSMEG_1061 family FMN-dependent PPOX-type flavoprotein n=1 Tax=Salipiger sp. PrR002 TaxID=2706489 RepID=UPI0034CEBCD6